jgi:hypothetical protein
MSTTARRTISGWIAAWLFSLLVTFAGWLIRRAFKAQEAHAQSELRPNFKPAAMAPRANKYHPPAPARYASVTDTICQGMSEDELVSTYGRPAHTSRTTPGREIWIYPGNAMANDNAKMTVTLENGIVTNWSESVTAH